MTGLHVVGGLALVTFLASCSHLEVRTEVYLPEALEIPEKARLIQKSLEGILATDPQGTNIDPFEVVDERALLSTLRDVWTELSELDNRPVENKGSGGEVFSGTSAEFASSFVDAARGIVAPGPSRRRVQELHLLARRLSTIPPYYEEPSLVLRKYDELSAGYLDVAQQINRAFDEVTMATKDDFGGAIRDYYSTDKGRGSETSSEAFPKADPINTDAPEKEAAQEPHRTEFVPTRANIPPANEVASGTSRGAPEVANGSGEEVREPSTPADAAAKSGKEKQEAEVAGRAPAPEEVAKWAARADELADQLIGKAFPLAVEAVGETQAVAKDASLLLMADPAVPRILNAPERAWRGIYNHVVGTTLFGNAEIAVRMESLGVFNMKGVVFDPSKVTKAVLDGVGSAIEIAAAASGAPLPTVEKELMQDEGEQARPEPLSKARLRAETRQIENDRRANLAAQAETFYSLLADVRDLPASGSADAGRVAASVETLRALVDRYQTDSATE